MVLRSENIRKVIWISVPNVCNTFSNCPQIFHPKHINVKSQGVTKVIAISKCELADFTLHTISMLREM